MSWRWSRLSILAFLALLYASPLSSGDKGLWISVTPLTVPLFGALPGGMPPEHSILLPDSGGWTRARAHVQRSSEPVSGPAPIVVASVISATWTTVRPAPFSSTRDSTSPAPSAPRGPPA